MDFWLDLQVFVKLLWKRYLGDDAMKASAYGIKNLKRIIVKLPNWTKEADKDYASLTNMYGQLVAQFTRYMGHVAKNIGGVEAQVDMVELRERSDHESGTDQEHHGESNLRNNEGAAKTAAAGALQRVAAGLL